MKQEYEYVIIGGGPAGLQLAHHMRRANHRYIVLERGSSPGTFFRQQPRHRMLLSINKRYTGYDDPELKLRWDWNSLLSDDYGLLFTSYSKDYFPDADDLVRYLVDYADRYALNVRCNTEVIRISKPNARFELETKDGDVIRARVVIVATGVSKPYEPAIPGIELTENYCDMSVDPEDYADQRVLIIGKGNSAFETANALVGSTRLLHMVSPNPVKMAWRSKYVGHLRAVNNDFIDTYHLKAQNVVLNAEVFDIRREGDGYVVSFHYRLAHDEEEELYYDRVLLCTGFRFDDSIFADSCRPQLTIHNRFPDLTSAWESVNVPGMYFAGVLMQVRDYKKKQSAFIHGFRYNVRALFHHLSSRYQDVPWPSREISSWAPDVAEEVLRRCNRSSGLWQQTGALCDLITVGKDGVLRYYEDAATDYAREILAGGSESYFVITLEFGSKIIAESPDIMAMERPHKDDASHAHESPALHPVIRQYRNGNQVAEHHVLEDLASEWTRPAHREPLREWFTEMLGETRANKATLAADARLESSSR